MRSWFSDHPASKTASKMHWATRFHQLRLSSAASCISSDSYLFEVLVDESPLVLTRASRSYPTIVLQCFDTVGWVIWPVKIVPDMTYNVFGGTLNPTLLLLLLLLQAFSWNHRVPNDELVVGSCDIPCSHHLSRLHLIMYAVNAHLF